MSRVPALLRATSVRFTALYYLPYCTALLAAGQARWLWLVLGAVYWFAHGLGTESLNRLADRTEDEINRAERTALCHRAGFPAIRRTAVAAWSTVALLDVVLLVLHPDPVLALFLLLAGLSAVNYSYGLRLSRNRWLAPLLLTFHFGGTFVIGWVLAQDHWDAQVWRDFAGYPLPFFVTGMVTLLALGGAKDLTDLAGDARIGYHSAWVELLQRRGAWIAGVMVGSTYLLVLVFVAAGLFPARFLLWLLLAPVGAALGRCLWRAASPEQQLATREFFYQYWMLSLSVAALLYAPRPGTLAAVAGTLAFWGLTTQRLHWSPGVRRATLRAVLSLVRPQGAGGRLRQQA
ncbi:UbiA family prenyltransferase [Streptomyces sp. JJ36]|uniref:UbiA family prenyltransferase n=1 Tax=Streptomyces sp. JJ36 TaxID=2736645 RepID=UPI001EFFFC21|nr:UbiA family prenyltransferase [Streptomyces sp. JJ36]MCF6524489.1 UbiA family prenyltransferase [Streptomyces sp. JJ36]